MDALPHPFPTRRLLATAVAGGLLLLGVGCSSSDDDEESSSTTAADQLSEDQWVEQANAICAETGPTIGAAFAAMDPTSPTPEQIDDLVATLVSVNRDTGERIDALAEPSALTAQVDELLAANEEATAAIEEQGPAALEALDQLFAPANELATEMGLDACAG